MKWDFKRRFTCGSKNCPTTYIFCGRMTTKKNYFDARNQRTIAPVKKNNFCFHERGSNHSLGFSQKTYCSFSFFLIENYRFSRGQSFSGFNDLLHYEISVRLHVCCGLFFFLLHLMVLCFFFKIKFASSTREYILKPDETVPIL